MMCSSIRQRSLSFVAALALAAPVFAADPIANPEYAGWAKCKPGATATVKGTTEAMGNKTAQTIVTKLLEVTPEKAVVETTVTMEMMGQKMAQPAQKRDIPKMVTPPAMPAGAEKMKMPEAVKGSETVDAVGKSVACETSEVTIEQNGIKTTAKTWTSAEIPGGMVKMTAVTSGKMDSKTTMELVEFKDGN